MDYVKICRSFNFVLSLLLFSTFLAIAHPRTRWPRCRGVVYFGGLVSYLARRRSSLVFFNRARSTIWGGGGADETLIIHVAMFMTMQWVESTYFHFLFGLYEHRSEWKIDAGNSLAEKVIARYTYK